MHRRLRWFILVLSIVMPAALVAQNSRLNGIWVAPIVGGEGPKVYVYTFKVEGDTFTGTIRNGAGAPRRFTDGKIENGHFSFSFPNEEDQGLSQTERYTGTLKDDRHLELVREVTFAGFKWVRRPGTAAAPNTPEGEWMQQGAPDPDVFYIFHVEGDKLTGELHDHFFMTDKDGGQPLVNEIRHLPLIDGITHGKEISFRYINHWNNPLLFTGTLAGDHLVMNSDVKSPFHAVRIVDAGAGSGAAAASGAQAASPAKAVTGTGNGKMSPYRDLARMAMEAVKKNDLATANTLCQRLERAWDEGEQGLRENSPDVWEQIDHAMDEFIHPILRSGGAAPDAGALDAAYRDYLNKLKLAD